MPSAAFARFVRSPHEARPFGTICLDIACAEAAAWRAWRHHMNLFAFPFTRSNRGYSSVRAGFALWTALSTLVIATAPARTMAREAAPHALVAIPFQHVDGRILLPVGVNGSSPMRFLLDTGASRCAVDAAVARQLRLSFEGRGLAQGAGGTAGIGILRGVTFNVPHLNLTINGNIFSVDLRGMKTSECDARPPLDGILGTAFFQNFVVTIDYEAEKIYLFDQKTYAYVGEGEQLPLEVTDRGLFVNATARFDGDVTCEGRFLVDTGFSGAMSINTPYVKKYDLVTRERPGYDSGVRSVGVGGTINARTSRVPALTVGKKTLRNVVAMLSLENNGAVAARDFKGIIGDRVLSHFRVTFDFKRHKLILERTGSTDKPFKYSASGLRLVASQGPTHGVTVCGFMTGSPAEAAGFQRGDFIVAVDGRSVVDSSVDEVDELLDMEGKEITVDALRGTKSVQIRFTPKQLL